MLDSEPDPKRPAGRQDRLEAGPRRDGSAAPVAIPATGREDRLPCRAVGGAIVLG